MTTQLARARQQVLAAESALADARAQMRKTALRELKRGVSATRIAEELGMSRAAVSQWARDAGFPALRKAQAQPLEADE